MPASVGPPRIGRPRLAPGAPSSAPPTLTFCRLKIDQLLNAVALGFLGIQVGGGVRGRHPARPDWQEGRQRLPAWDRAG